jgi:L-iditol 2-dehydrogenase
MKAILVKSIGSFELTEIAAPILQPGEVLVKVAVAGLCRTDLKIIETGHRDLVLPRVPGEEVVGTVCALGQGCAAGWLGARVYIYPGVSCGVCRCCRSGAQNLCGAMRIMGFHRDGGFAEYVAAPVASLIRLSAALPFEAAVFAEPLSCCLNALELARVAAGDKVIIWGAGPAGTLLYRATKALGGIPRVVEPDRRRCKLIGGSEAPPADNCDVAIVATGSPEAYEQALAGLGARGRLVVFSGLPPEQSRRAVDFNRLHYREQAVIGAYGCSYRHGEQALAWIEEGRVPVADLISHRLPLAELGAALDLVRRRAGMKILLYPGQY